MYAAGLNDYGGFEVQESRWKVEIEEQNLVTFPDGIGWDVRHFAFVFHDSMFECLAVDYVLRSIGVPDTGVFEKALHDF